MLVYAFLDKIFNKKKMCLDGFIFSVSIFGVNLLSYFVETVWEKNENSAFHEHKELLLNYLEKLGLVAKPQHSNSDEVTKSK